MNYMDFESQSQFDVKGYVFNIHCPISGYPT